MMTLAPQRPSSTAMAAPMPRPAPVTRATLPSRRKGRCNVELKEPMLKTVLVLMIWNEVEKGSLDGHDLVL